MILTAEALPRLIQHSDKARSMAFTTALRYDRGGQRVGFEMIRLILLAALMALPATRVAAETSHLVFVTEYARELGVNEHMRELGEKDMAEDTDKLSATIRSSTRILLELNSQISMMKRTTLNAPFDSLPGSIAEFYQFKVGIHQKMIDLATALMSGPKPGVDYGAMVAEAPKLTATLEFVDRSIFQTTPMIFATLIADKPDSQGHMSRLRIKRAERDKLVQFLQIDFGAKMDAKDQNYIVSSASVLRDFLMKKGYKCSDDPP